MYVFFKLLLYTHIAKSTEDYHFPPLFSKFMINQENLTIIVGEGGNTSNQEIPDQIKRVGISGLCCQLQMI